MTYPLRHKAIVITGAGGPEMLQQQDRSTPQPGPDQVLIKVSAAGINRHDCNQRAAGHCPDGNPVPGLEAAGVIVALGSDVLDLAIGDRVMGLLQGGGYAEYAVADAAVVMRIPSGLSDVEAACTPEALFTAWWNFFGLMNLQPQEFALIHGGTSGVGHLALQAMSALGYRVLATAGHAEKVKAAKGFGAFAAFDYHDPKLAAKVQDATDGAGVDALLDMSAGAHLEADLAMMATGGRIAHLSAGGGAVLNVPLKALMAKRLCITGSLLRPLELHKKAEIAVRIKRDVMPLLGKSVRPVIAAEFALPQAAEAHRAMEQNSHIGKIALRIADMTGG